MASAFHKKIQAVLKQANLPKSQAEDLKKELESYFYEKERDLQLAGLKSDEIEKRLVEDFGDDKAIGQTFQFVHSFNFYIKSVMRKIITFVAIFAFILAFLSPWYWIDNGEALLETDFFREGNDQIFTQPRDRIPVSLSVDEGLLSDLEKMCYCDGSCMRAEWAPFGAKVIGCAEDYYYVSFWGQRFHINGK